MFLSIVVPAYNESQRLGQSLGQIAQFLAAQSYLSEVLIVDDGSVDNTVALANGYIEEFAAQGITLRVLQNPGNRGKGYSVRHGMRSVQGEIALFTDADLSAPIEEVTRLIAPIINNEHDLVFGSRALTDSNIFTHQSIVREMAGRSFNLLMRLITGLPYQDTQCGFKAFRVKTGRVVFEQQQIEGFGFDVELLYIAQKHGLRVLELPVSWGDVAGSKVSLFRGLKAFLDIGLVRWYDLVGCYPTKIVKEEKHLIS